MKIYIIGSGKLASAILESPPSIQGCEVIKWDSSAQQSNDKAILVHAGSGRQLNECIAYCRKTKSVFIELSTGLETETMMPDFPLVICPNTSILVLKTMHMLKQYGRQFIGYDISITESHQAAKTTEPGTAYAFANALAFPTNQIKSVRDVEVQQNRIGIPLEYLGKHAYHKIIIKDGNDEVAIETKVLGHDSYAKGVKAIVEAVLSHNIANGRQSVLDLIDKNLL
jgi:4-hydroxy-tetrahydrodipicolinate reductase